MASAPRISAAVRITSRLAERGPDGRHRAQRRPDPQGGDGGQQEAVRGRARRVECEPRQVQDVARHHQQDEDDQERRDADRTRGPAAQGDPDREQRDRQHQDALQLHEDGRVPGLLPEGVASADDLRDVVDRGPDQEAGLRLGVAEPAEQHWVEHHRDRRQGGDARDHEGHVALGDARGGQDERQGDRRRRAADRDAAAGETTEGDVAPQEDREPHPQEGGSSRSPGRPPPPPVPSRGRRWPATTAAARAGRRRLAGARWR